MQISIKISLKFVPRCPISNIPALVQIMDWRRPGDKPLSEPMMVSSLTHICVTWPQWVKRRYMCACVCLYTETEMSFWRNVRRCIGTLNIVIGYIRCFGNLRYWKSRKLRQNEDISVSVISLVWTWLSKPTYTINSLAPERGRNSLASVLLFNSFHEGKSSRKLGLK